MNQSLLITLATGTGLLVGIGGTWLVTANSEAIGSAEASSKAELMAAIKADPSLCPAPPATLAAPSAAGLEVPSLDEAIAAFRRAKPSYPHAIISLGQCEKNQMGPGVSCAVDIQWSDDADRQAGVVGFSRTSSGWQAAHYY